MKENARKLLAKVGITRSFPNGKRSVNAGIHAIFLDSAVFTVSENTEKRPQKAGFHSLTAVNSRFSRLKTQGKCRNTRLSPSVNRSVNVSKRMFTGVHWIGKLMDNGTNTRINRGENVWKTKDFPLGESQKMRVNCAFFVNSPRVFSVGKCHFFCRASNFGTMKVNSGHHSGHPNRNIRYYDGEGNDYYRGEGGEPILGELSYPNKSSAVLRVKSVECSA